jgi:hypothetical protein
LTASSTLKSEQTIRRKLGRGEKEFRAATEVIFSRMEAREAGWKTRRLCSSVMMRVLLGGLGRERGGRLERSKVREGLDLGEVDWEGCELTWTDAILLLLLLEDLCSSDNSRSFFDKV